jgi:hypothetical protein
MSWLIRVFSFIAGVMLVVAQLSVDGHHLLRAGELLVIMALEYYALKPSKPSKPTFRD